MSYWDFSMRLGLAMVLGLFIGLEREYSHKSAGLRTSSLIAIGSAIYVLLSISITQTNGDVTRIIGQVVTGTGFLCGGLIFRDGVNVRNLTTSATIWCSSAIGCLAAGGFIFESIISSIAVLFINIVLRPIDKSIENKEKSIL